MDGVIRNSVITCPHCSFAQREEMPIDARHFPLSSSPSDPG
jgi:hypothetical protein